MKMIPRLLVGLTLASLPAFCGAISENTWYLFNWTQVSNQAFATSGDAGTPAAPWTLPTTFAGGTFLLADADLNQQKFALWDNGVQVGITTTPVGSVNCGHATPDSVGGPACFGTAGMSISTGSPFFTLAAGAHILNIATYLDGGVASGVGFFDVCTTQGCASVTPPPPPPPPAGVPEPATMGMMGLGLGLGGVLFRWRNRK